MAVLERWFPYRSEWKASASDMVIGGSYYALANFLDFGVNYLLPLPLLLAVGKVPSWGSVLACLLVVDLFSYWVHRLAHLGPLSRFHYIHHEPHAVNLWVTNVTHFVYVPVSVVGRGALAWVFGFDLNTFVWALLISSWFMYYTHLNYRLSFGPVDYFIMGPGHHRRHHSLHRAIADTNYGVVFALWDQLFGTWSGFRDNIELVGVEEGTTQRPTYRNLLAYFNLR